MSTVDLLSMPLSSNHGSVLPVVPVRRLWGSPSSLVVVLRTGELWPFSPRVRGSSPWRRTHSRLLTCAHAIDKIICQSRVDIPVLERCSLAGSGLREIRWFT